MRKVILTAAFLIRCLSFKLADAQVRLSLGVNISAQPEWGPVGYARAQYYYMPDIDAYYDVPAHQYVYYENNAWVHGRALPPRYHFDKYNSYKVVVNQPRPWEHQEQIRTRYASYRGHQGQAVIRDSHDQRYRNHWKEDGRHDNGRHNGGDHHDHGHDH